jgi:hypothetical protein
MGWLYPQPDNSSDRLKKKRGQGFFQCFLPPDLVFSFINSPHIAGYLPGKGAKNRLGAERTTACVKIQSSP